MYPPPLGRPFDEMMARRAHFGKSCPPTLGTFNWHTEPWNLGTLKRKMETNAGQHFGPEKNQIPSETNPPRVNALALRAVKPCAVKKLENHLCRWLSVPVLSGCLLLFPSCAPLVPNWGRRRYTVSNFGSQNQGGAGFFFGERSLV